jgi:hypothetical protein
VKIFCCVLSILFGLKYFLSHVVQLVYGCTVNIVGVVSADDEDVRGNFSDDPDDTALA